MLHNSNEEYKKKKIIHDSIRWPIISPLSYIDNDYGMKLQLLDYLVDCVMDGTLISPYFNQSLMINFINNNKYICTKKQLYRKSGSDYIRQLFKTHQYISSPKCYMVISSVDKILTFTIDNYATWALEPDWLYPLLGCEQTFELYSDKVDGVDMASLQNDPKIKEYMEEIFQISGYVDWSVGSGNVRINTKSNHISIIDIEPNSWDCINRKCDHKSRIILQNAKKEYRNNNPNFKKININIQEILNKCIEKLQNQYRIL